MTSARLIVAALGLSLAFAGMVRATCSFCGSGSYGACPHGKVHKHTD